LQHPENFSHEIQVSSGLTLVHDFQQNWIAGIAQVRNNQLAWGPLAHPGNFIHSSKSWLHTVMTTLCVYTEE
jgi:hypothetical protein